MKETIEMEEQEINDQRTRHSCSLLLFLRISFGSRSAYRSQISLTLLPVINKFETTN